MTKKKILVVEDEQDILDLVGYHLDQAGYEVMKAAAGDAALKMIEATTPDLLVLDIMLPGLSGLEVCKHVRLQEKTKYMPIVMLTAKSDEIDRVVGFELGADDYVTKPFSPRELVLRIKAILKRLQTPETKPDVIEIDGMIIDRPKHRVMLNTVQVDLTATEFNLLLMLVERRGRVQTRDMLLESVWGYEYIGFTRTVDTHMRRLRSKLDRWGDYIETVRGVGYRFRDREDG